MSHRVPRLGECMVVSVSMFIVPVFSKIKKTLKKKSMIYDSDDDDEDKSSSCPCFKTSSCQAPPDEGKGGTAPIFLTDHLPPVTRRLLDWIWGMFLPPAKKNEPM